MIKQYAKGGDTGGGLRALSSILQPSGPGEEIRYADSILYLAIRTLENK